MKLAIQYIHDGEGRTQAVQLPITDWKKILNKLKKYEQALKLKTDLDEAFKEAKKMQKGELQKVTLADFLNEL